MSSFSFRKQLGLESGGPKRGALWGSLIALVAALLVTLVWLAARYEASQLQDQLERDLQTAVSDIRSELTRNLQSLQTLPLHASQPAQWEDQAMQLLRTHREIVRLEWRNMTLDLQVSQDSLFRPPVFEHFSRNHVQIEWSQACGRAQKSNAASYSISYFVPMQDGMGLEVMDLCQPVVLAGVQVGYLLATYALEPVLQELLGPTLARNQEVSITEADGTRLAVRPGASRGKRVFTDQQILDLPGNTLVLRMNSSRLAPDLFPNVLTAVVTGMSVALVYVLFLLGKDMRRRLRAEHDLGDALAFRKAMEDSLVTGLRARDLEGKTTYVNPAFCQMVGFTGEELMQATSSAPYWPTALVDEYARRQAIRLAGHVPPREGFESVFMRRDGSQFPVMILEAPLINAQGQQTGWMSACVDISEQRRVQEQSRASHDRLQATARLAAVGEMASLLSHELNQPLAAIASYATGSVNLLGSAQSGLAPALQHDVLLALQRIGEQAQRAGKVIKSVNDFARRREAQREAVHPQALVEAVMPLIGLQARKLAVRVQVQIDNQLPAVLCDRTMVEQVVLNLARNAMQAMEHIPVQQRFLLLQATVRAAKAQLPAQLCFSLADQGVGITPEVQTHLFTPFFTTKVEGMGLGLSLCRTVMEQHGGSLWFETNQPQGTVFSFSLPLAMAGPVVQDCANP